MNKSTLLSLSLAIVSGLAASSAYALPPINMAFLDAYKSSPIAALAREARCDVCHVGPEQETRNDYGLTLLRLGVTQEAFMELRRDQEKLAEFFNEAFKKAEEEESVSGVKFGELIRSGRLPGTPPEAAEGS